jgi:dihydrofolate reductase
MSRLRVHGFSISLDGFGAGHSQSLENPLGVGGEALHEWILPTRTFQKLEGKEGGTTGVDDDILARGFASIGAWILGRNMFGPVRGPWPDESWKGWWGDNPPYHVPVFVLTHHPRASIDMNGGTTFHFVTNGPEAALERATQAAGGLDIRLGGGADDSAVSARRPRRRMQVAIALRCSAPGVSVRRSRPAVARLRTERVAGAGHAFRRHAIAVCLSVARHAA